MPYFINILIHIFVCLSKVRTVRKAKKNQRNIFAVNRNPCVSVVLCIMVWFLCMLSLVCSFICSRVCLHRAKKVAKNRKFCVKIAIDPHFQRISNILFLCKWYSVAFWNYQMTWENEIMWIRTFTEQNGNLHNLLQLQQFSNDAKNIFSHQTHTQKRQNWVSVAETVFFSTELVDESEKNVRFKFKKTLPKIFIHYHFMASFFFYFPLFVYGLCLHHKHETNAKNGKIFFRKPLA